MLNGHADPRARGNAMNGPWIQPHHAPPVWNPAADAPARPINRVAERRRLVWALMHVQAAAGMLATLGLLAFAVAFAPTPGMALLFLFNLGKNVTLVWLAARLVRGGRGARRATLWLEAVS